MTDDTTVRQFVYLAGEALESWNATGMSRQTLQMGCEALAVMGDALDAVAAGHSSLVPLGALGEMAALYQMAAAIALMTGLRKLGRTLLCHAASSRRRALKWGQADRGWRGRAIRPGWNSMAGLSSPN